MKILTTNSVKTGIRNAIARIPDLDGIMWNPEIKPAFDAFNEFKPDILFAYLSDINKYRAIQKCIGEYKVKTVLFNDSVIPGVSCQEGVKLVDMPYAVDDALYHKVEPDPKYTADISYINTATNDMDFNFILPLCDSMEYNIKIYGNPVSLSPQWCGHIRDEERRHIFSSTRINIITPNSDKELIYQINACDKNALVLTYKDINNVSESLKNFVLTLEKKPPVDKHCTYLEIVKKLL